jgi:hypothetical protein
MRSTSLSCKFIDATVCASLKSTSSMSLLPLVLPSLSSTAADLACAMLLQNKDIAMGLTLLDVEAVLWTAFAIAS